MKVQRAVVNAEPIGEARRRLPSPSTAVAVDALLKLSTNSQPMQLRELARVLEVPRTTLHRILQTLEAKRMVEHHVGSGYVLGRTARDLAVQYRLSELPRLARPIIDELHGRTGETVNLAMPHDDGMLIVTVVQSPEPLRMVSVVGSRDHFHTSALGKAYLAALDESSLEEQLGQLELIAETPNAITDPERLRRELETTRARSYAIDDEESVIGVRCVAAVILADGGAPIGSLSVSGPASRLPDKLVGSTGLLVVRAAANLSGLLGAGA